MKKILKICSPQLGLNPNSYLGGEVHDHFVIQNLAKKGHKIFVYLPKNRPYQKNKNIKTERALIQHIPAFTFNIIILPYLFRTYKKEQFDILRVHNPYFVGLGAFVFKLFHPKVQVITTYHLVEKKIIYNFINAITIKKYDKVFAVSNFVKNWLDNSYDLEKNFVQVLYNGVSPIIRPASKNKKLIHKYKIEGKFILFFMGLLIPRKNPLFAIKVFENLKKKYPNLALLISGKGSLAEDLKKYIKNRKIGDVTLTGTVLGLKKTKHFNVCDAFILPSNNEGFGLVVAEAMACSKPVVVNKSSSLKEIVSDGRDGFLCKSNKIKDWEEKLSVLINNHQLRKKMGKQAFQKAKNNFSWSKIIDEYINILSKLTENVS